MLKLWSVPLLMSSLLSGAPPTVSHLLRTSTTWNGAAIRYSACAKPEVQGVVVEIAPGESTPWHKHPSNNYAYILAGTLRLELRDQTSHVFKTGEAFAESVDTWHRGTNIGAGPLKILVFYTGEAGLPLSINAPDTEAPR